MVSYTHMPSRKSNVSNPPAEKAAAGVLTPDEYEKAQQRFGELFATTPTKVFLLGAGCSHCAKIPLTKDITNTILNGKRLTGASQGILDDIKKNYGKAPVANIEDYLSDVIDLLAIAERRAKQGAHSSNGNHPPLDALKSTAAEIKHAIAKIIIEHEEATGVLHETSAHRCFVRTAHGLTAGRIRGTRTDYLCLNYDTLLEKALALEKIPYADGIRGGGFGWWDQETFLQDGLAARVFKLHGSVNWRSLDGEPFPRRIEATMRVDGGEEFMIWPASTKYSETRRDPYAQLAQKGWEGFKMGMLSADRLLIICGYRFADDHINGAIEQALSESEKHLTVVAFVDKEATEKLRTWFGDRFAKNILIYSEIGFFHGDYKRTAEDLQWWKFENFHKMIPGGEQ